MASFYHKLSAEVYDLDKPIGHSFGDVEFYLNKLQDCKGTILEPATGTGRILIPLLENGLSVEGFDSSSEMLQLCKKNCKKRGLAPKLIEADMESFSMEKQYSAIILPTGSFLLLSEREKSLKALKNFYRHLNKGGKFIVDLIVQEDFKVGETSTKIWECPNGDMITMESVNVEINYVHQYTVSLGKYERWRNGSLIETELEHFPLRWYGVEEFKLILEKVGFDNIIISADYCEGKYPDTNTEIITFEATKV